MWPDCRSSARKRIVLATSCGPVLVFKKGAAFLSIDVSTAPGTMLLTRILYDFPSPANMSLRPNTPYLDTTYALNPLNFSGPRTPPSEVILTIAPPFPEAIIWQKASRLHKKDPLKFVLITFSQVAKSIATKSRTSTTPALLTRISSGPKFALAISKRCLTWFSSLTSVGTANASYWPHWRFTSSATFDSSASFLLARTTLAPSCANKWTVAAPIPRLAPVTMAIFFSNAPGISLSPRNNNQHIHQPSYQGEIALPLAGDIPSGQVPGVSGPLSPRRRDPWKAPRSPFRPR